MAYMNETEVRTQVRRDDRFGGYNRVEQKQRTLFEPDFKPFAFGQTEDIVASSETADIVAAGQTEDIVAYGQTEDIVASTEQIVASEPEFDFERQYGFSTNPYEQEKREMNITSFKRSQQVESQQQQRTYARAKLNARGKIAIAVYSIVTLIIVAFCIYNGVMISSLNGDIANKSEIVATQTQVINQLEATYNSLGEEEYIVSQVGDSFKVPTEADTVKVKGFELKERKQKAEETNWFEDFCETLRKLFS